ncbi:hypothetical protein [Actinacidiphila sp. bgisy160]|uniref:hypothetical protein n=1 Tax=Actinacidiphila sp. bgisy160 TaxID=3413796 RepID=UPI003D75740B
MRRTIQTELDKGLSKMLLDGTLNPGDTVVADIKDGRLSLGLKEGQSREPAKEAAASDG